MKTELNLAKQLVEKLENLQTKVTAYEDFITSNIAYRPPGISNGVLTGRLESMWREDAALHDETGIITELVIKTDKEYKKTQHRWKRKRSRKLFD